MVKDVVRELGFLTLGTRMKRIGERLQADSADIAAAHGIALHAGQATFIETLDRLGPLTVGEIAEALGVTQPGATRNVAELARKGLVKVAPGKNDQRQRVVTLTAKGRRLVETGQREVWPRIEAAVVELCANLGGPLLDQLTAIEDGLAEQSLLKRAEKNTRSN
jgi:DNA-binding MarR family transcriptional regulator